MTQKDKAHAFARLHTAGDPLVLYNIWDAGSAGALAKAGAPALATGSASVAGAQGYGDGQKIPMATLLQIVERIVAVAPDLPVSVDFEGGYAVEPDALGENIRALIAAGAVGINFEDQVVGHQGLHSASEQAARIAAIRAAADSLGLPLFINARTDLFLKAQSDAHADLLPEALARAAAYADAGASGFFVPGLIDPAMIARICDGTVLPVNVMVSPAAPPKPVLVDCGAARLSHGPFPYLAMLQDLGAAYLKAAEKSG
jgi:2-methylisocitrate lyase-like PEP mutase family enzyme